MVFVTFNKDILHFNHSSGKLTFVKGPGQFPPRTWAGQQPQVNASKIWHVLRKWWKFHVVIHSFKGLSAFDMLFDELMYNAPIQIRWNIYGKNVSGVNISHGVKYYIYIHVWLDHTTGFWLISKHNHGFVRDNMQIIQDCKHWRQTTLNSVHVHACICIQP